MRVDHSMPLRRRQRGVSLADALFALLVLSIGMLALSRLQIDLREGADGARDRSVAVRLAQQETERLRAFGDLAGWEAIADDSADVTPSGSSTRYTLERVVGAHGGAALKSVTVTLHWTDRHGAAQQLRLDTLVAGPDPALSGALTLARPPFTHP